MLERGFADEQTVVCLSESTEQISKQRSQSDKTLTNPKVNKKKQRLKSRFRSRKRSRQKTVIRLRRIYLYHRHLHECLMCKCVCEYMESV